MVSSVFTIPLGSAARPKSGGRRASQAAAPLLDAFIGDRDNALVRVLVESFLTEPRYNPLVLTGPPAVGKTYLATGLAARWTETQSDRSAPRPAIVLTGADFARSYADALETDSLDVFRTRLLRAGAVVIDGLEQLVEKIPAQLECARLLDLWIDCDVRVLITFRRDPELPELHPALWSRLHGGLLAPLAPPGDEARRKILRELLRRQQVRLQPDALAALESHSTLDATKPPTVPQLAQLVEQLAAAARNVPQPWSSDTIRSYLSSRGRQGDVELRDIARTVAAQFGMTVAELKGPSRRRQVVRARSLAVYLARQLTDESLERLGKFFGGRDHTTTLHAVRSTEQLLATDSLLQQTAAAITRQLDSLAAGATS